MALHPLRLLLPWLFALVATRDAAASDALTDALARSAANRSQLERALATVPGPQKRALEWLLPHAPTADLATLDGEFLLAHVDAAWSAWQSAPWKANVDEELFFDALLPYASVSESRELWLPKLREICLPLVAGESDPGRAAVRLNQQLFAKLKVRYSTERQRADQSPSESIASGLASCTGLSILLIDACRSIGVPARFVGVPLWIDRSGNHSWVEVWDGARWRFTGAAEPAGDALDEAWFTGRASAQSRDDPQHAIYAVTWRESPLDFPMVFDPRRPRARAVDVTDRYAGPTQPLPAGHSHLHVGLTGRDGRRVARELLLQDESGREVARGTTKDERFDANDYLALVVPRGQLLTAIVDGRPIGAFRFSEPTATANSTSTRVIPTVSWEIDASDVAGQLEEFLHDHELAEVAQQPFAYQPLSAEEVGPIALRLIESFDADLRARERASFDARIVEAGGVSMKFWYAVYGDKPARGRSLYLSLHGGGGAPPAVNDQQWENQKRLYRPDEGVYLAPRAPSDTWNLWHQGHIDPLFQKLIAQLILFEEVDPDRVYVMGYSAGGDGVYQLAPRLADHFAAAAMMAGHPNETRPDGLRNLPFTLHMGGKDDAYDRANIGRRWKQLLAELAAADPGGYPHEVVIHEGKGHWMDREDAVAVPWMAQHTRELRPTTIVWLQDDVTTPRFYWLANPAPAAGARVVAKRAGNEVVIESAVGVQRLAVRLDDSMADLSKPIRVRAGATADGALLFEGIVPRTIATLTRTLLERGDPRGLFSAEIVVDWPTERSR